MKYEHIHHPKDAMHIDDTPTAVVNEEGFVVARFAMYNDAKFYIAAVNEEYPCALLDIEGGAE
jgi:hypothetical protein